MELILVKCSGLHIKIIERLLVIKPGKGETPWHIQTKY